MAKRRCRVYQAYNPKNKRWVKFTFGGKAGRKGIKILGMKKTPYKGITKK